ncbi:MAG: C1 family peptidase [Thermonemataceae bacterium]
MMRKRLFLLLYTILSTTATWAQRFDSCLLDTAVYNQVPLAAPLMRGDYQNLPTSHSLKKFAATPKDQGDLGTCVGWATAYMARTIMLAQKEHWQGASYITEKALSPFFVYENIKAYDDRTCLQGATLYAAFESLKNTGTVQYAQFAKSCNQAVTSTLREKAQAYRIQDYKRLFPTSTKDKVSYVKKSIAEDKPVVIGVKCCVNSFLNVEGAVWNISPEDDFSALSATGGHAVTVVGYDDEKYGGAFEIMNSWGTAWGNEGFLWVRFKDFNDFCFEAYEMVEKDDFSNKLAGEVQLKLSAGHTMPLQLKSGMYEATQAYRSGTLFRLYVANFQPAYVYIFSTDLTRKNFAIFPYSDHISPYLGYRRNRLALPSEQHYIEMDETKGLDYYCILYAKEKLHLPSILEALTFTEGNFKERLQKVIGMKLVKTQEQQLVTDTIRFTAPTTEGTVIPIIIAIPHQ